MNDNLFDKYLSYVNFVLSRSIQCEYNMKNYLNIMVKIVKLIGIGKWLRV